MDYGNNMEALPVCDRPYEKIETYGAEILSDSELLATIIRCGTKKQNAVSVARNLLNTFDGDISKVLEAGISELCKIDGIGRTKAVQIKALNEIAKRTLKKRTCAKVSAKTPEIVGEMLVTEMADRKTESFRVVLLDKKLNVCGMKDITSGTLDRTLVHPREVFSYAIRELSAAIIVAHNHPSGDVTPSADDIELTRRLVEAGDIIGISVLDHIIVGGTHYFSMKKAEIMPKAYAAA